MTAYGAGLRIFETCALRTTDIDRERMLIHVRGGKGAKDRYVISSLRYWQDSDRALPPKAASFKGRYSPEREEAGAKTMLRTLADAQERPRAGGQAPTGSTRAATTFEKLRGRAGNHDSLLAFIINGPL